MKKRVFENPLIRDKVTLLESCSDTGGACTLVEVELAAGGGNSSITIPPLMRTSLRWKERAGVRTLSLNVVEINIVKKSEITNS